MGENLARIEMEGTIIRRTRTGNAFATTANPVRREYTGTTPKCTACNYHHSPETPCHTCFNSNCPGHFSKDYRVVPRNVNPINARNPTARAYYKCVVAVNGGQGRGNNGNQARGREFMLGVEEVRQDPNIMTGTFTLNNHYAITLFDSGADYSFVSTTFIPRLGIEPSDLGLSYEIEKASGQLVEIDKVSKGCKLEIEGHVFDINLIPFGSGSFDVIIGMDWLANHKDEIISHEKVVRIPLPDGKVLRVIRERPDEKVRLIMSAKAKEQKQEEIVVVRDFPEEEHEVHPGIVLELLKKEKLYAKFSKCEFWLREVQFLGHVINGDGIHVDPSKIEAVKNWKPFRTLSETQKSKTFDLGEEQDNAFQTLKGKLCDAPILALPDGPEYFVSEETEHAIELFSNYDGEIRYHPGKENVVADALSRKERVKPKRVRAMNMTLQLSIKDRILAAQKEACDVSTGLQYGFKMRLMSLGVMELYTTMIKFWVPWCLTCLKVKAKHQRLSGLLQQPEILEWKQEGTTMDFVTKLPRTSSRHDTIWGHVGPFELVCSFSTYV
ncbi:putative reverse transcriptase domain-containing protein [Tanacetum coccineum]